MIVLSDTLKTSTRSNIPSSEYDAAEPGTPVGDGQNPPSYDLSILGMTPGPARADTATGPRVNYIYIKRANHDIKGEWTIDPTVRVPPSLLSPLDEGEERANLRLHSQHHSVRGKVRLISDQPTKSFLHASSPNGSVTMKILSRQNQRFKLELHSPNGNVTAQIPPDFEGPVTFRALNGSLKFSELVKRRVAYHSQSEGVGKAFIGDLSTSGYADIDDDVEAWSGDELILSAENGRIKIEYAEESPELASGAGASERSWNFWKKFMRGSAAPPAPIESLSMLTSSTSLPTGGPRPAVLMRRKN
ncbi:hypothetical protein FRB96_006942 [Tulasnella sp. 330]|nr:hypothetical protein FRB96_006942 [Tulasnella sp. 330]KAG8876556.1 hypothetical protein FRB97_004109 [Tulasnella sp. 331]